MKHKKESKGRPWEERQVIEGVMEVWCGVLRCGVMWCGVVSCGVVWCGVVWWCGVV